MTLSVQQKSEMISFTQEQQNLLKNYLCKGITDDELKLFSAVCRKTGLDPFMKQIYAVKRLNRKTGVEDMTIQTSIDGYRLIAERTGRYSPGRESTFTYDNNGKLTSATSYVKKQTNDGTWHEIGASAFLSEYKPSFPNNFWDTKTHIMLAKCAEALALRKAFPNELSGLYSDDEMAQADAPIKPIRIEITADETLKFEELLSKCSQQIQDSIWDYIKNQVKVDDIHFLPKKQYNILIKRMNELLQESNLEIKNEEIKA